LSRIIELPVGSQFELGKAGSLKPDFELYTAGMESDPRNNRLVHMVGSSTEKDMQGDIMSLHALNDMTSAQPNMTIWLNHDYTLPDSIFGSVVGAPGIRQKSGIADLELTVDVELDNPNASKVKRYVDNGRKLGCSIGCMVTKYEVPDENDGEDWIDRNIIIHGVYVVEYSVVGIPCNQRSWVENAVKGVFARTLDKSLVPAMKSLWTRSFNEIQSNLVTQGKEDLAKEFQAIPARKGSKERIQWHVPTKTFVMSGAGVQKALDREALASYLSGQSKEIDGQLVEIDPEDTNSTPIEDEMKIIKNLVSVQTEEPPVDPEKEAPELIQKAMNNDEEDDSKKKPADKKKPEQDDSEEEDEEDDGKKKPAGKKKPKPGQDDSDDDKEQKQDKKEIEPELTKEADLDEATAVTLKSYNLFGKALGLPEVTIEHIKEANHPALKSVKASPEQMGHVQAIHDHAAAMGGCSYTENATNVSDARNEAALGAGRQVNSGDHMAGLNKLNETLGGLAKAFEGLNVKEMQENVTSVKRELGEAQKQIDALYAEAAKASDTITSLKNLPLGNPVHLSRSVSVSDGITTHQELLAIKDSSATSEDTLEAALALTMIKTETLRNGAKFSYRMWPTSVGKGIRPELTSNQRMFMQIEEIKAYESGLEARVPYIDDPAS
jgi:hypothetical protein